MNICNICNQVLGGSELHCGNAACPNTNYHSLIPMWTKILSHTAIDNRKQIRCDVDVYQGIYRVRLSVNSLILAEVHITDTNALRHSNL